jgi:uncharacterized protein YeaO (DUF488 family)
VDVRVKRVYDKPAASDGERILIDRLWPRGFTHARAHVDGWVKDLGPSTELRQWFGHDPARFEGFRRRYEAELNGKEAMLADLRRRARTRRLTLVYAARDTEHNEAVVLAEVLRRGKTGGTHGER